MKCTEAKEFLQNHFTSNGIDLDESVREHIESCPDCKEFFNELAGLGNTLAPLTDLQLTADEAANMSTEISRLIAVAPAVPRKIIPVHARENKIFSFARILFAAAAVLVMVIFSSNPTQYDTETASADNYSGIQYLSVNDYDVALLLEDSDDDILPSYVDQSSAAYLASQLQPGEVDYLIESLSEEDIAWIENNLSVEI